MGQLPCPEDEWRETTECLYNVGNRLTQETQAGTSTYTYDNANRLTSVDGVSYTWDANGNLLYDGVSTYTYNRANRLTAFNGLSAAVSFGYNGLGDRLRQTVNGVPTNYSLDLAGGLTQVLADGTNTYLYGQGRIAQHTAASQAYFLGDALGSVRQLVDADGLVTLARSYAPYGEVLTGAGAGSTAYGFTGEWTDATGLVYLRARYYAPGQGRFISRDSWSGITTRPLSYNKWLYGFSNPSLFVDRTGLSPKVDCGRVWPSYMQALCEVANGDDNDPNVLNAREEFFANIAKYSKLLGAIETLADGVDSGFWWAGDMLEHFLLEGGTRSVILPYNTSFERDKGILRAVKEKLGPKYSDEPREIMPLLYVFLKEYLQPQVGCESYQVIPPIHIDGENTYIPRNSQPRAQSIGWWGAFGHVVIDADYSDIVVLRNFDNSGYVVKTTVKYGVEDRYEFFPGKKTPLPLGGIDTTSSLFPPVRLVYIPHEWELSLVASGRAAMYDFTISWSEYMQIIVPDDFSEFLLIGEWTKIPLE